MNTESLQTVKNFFASKLTLRQFSTGSKIAYVLIFLLALGLGLRLPSLLAKDEPRAASTAPASRLLPVETIAIETLSSYRATRAYTGQIDARRSSDLGFERTGKLITLAVDEGARVAAQTPLAILDTQELLTTQQALQAQRAQAQAQLEEMRAGPRQETIDAARAQVIELQAELDLAQRQRERRHNLWKKGVVAREAFDTADAERRTWQARLDAAQRRLDELLAGTRAEQLRAQEAVVAQFDAQLAALSIDLEKSVLKAPFAGTIAARLADEGTVVSTGQTILRLVEHTHLEARVGVPAPVAGKLTPGTKQRIQIGQTSYDVTVASLLPELDATTRTVMVVFDLPKAAVNAVVPGQVVRLQLEETIEAAGFWLPLTALTKGDRGLWSCYALVREPASPKSHFRTEPRIVEVLHTENNRVFVRGLLQPGELVVKAGTHRLVAGQPVQPVTGS